MQPEVVKQIVETIKTLNLNINDATTQKLADAVMPLVKWYYVMDFTKYILGWVFSIVLIGILAWMTVQVTKAIMRGLKEG